MDSDSTEMANEIKSKVILHWNCRGLEKLPEAIRTYGTHIREIYLKWNKLTTLPPWIIELFNVTNLYIYGNMIKELPPEFGQMSQLTVLDLSANKLKQVPPCIGNLVNLKSFLISDNTVEKLPSEMKQLGNLEILYISGNKFVALPEWIGSLPKLEELNADNNYIKELPNRLTLSPKLSMISVCYNRLRYLPLNAFVSYPCIRFDGNAHLNYLSLPLLYQLTGTLQNEMNDVKTSLGYRCFEMHCENNVSHTNIKLNIKLNASQERSTDFIIELPRQLLKVYNVHENTTVSLWELALRKVYTERFEHILNASTTFLHISYRPIATNNQKLDSIMSSINYASYNLLMNGPASICVNFMCRQPIFTEAWLIAGVTRHAEFVITIALCCCKRCAFEFATGSNMTVTLDWHCTN